MAQIKGVFFDLDGVLVDMAGKHYLSFNKALKEVAGYEISRELHLSTFNGISTRRKLELLEQMGKVKPEQKDRIWELKQKYTEDFINQLSHDPVKVDMLRKLKNEGRIVSCVSNSIRASVELMLSQTGQLPFFDYWYGNEDYGDRIKPDPFPYLMAMERAGIRPEESLLVEDAPKGIAAAHASGGHVLEVAGVEEVNYERVSARIRQIEQGQ